MKLNTTILFAAALCGFMAPASIQAEEKGHDHKEHAGEFHEEHKIKAPNKGRMIMSVDPHAEFFITKDRKIQITFVDDDGKKVAVGEQKVSIICGSRANPTVMKMEKKDGVLISSNTLPEGNDFPTIVTIKVKPDAKSVREKFNLNMKDCPTCDSQEYGCTCNHGDDHEGHDH